MHRLKAIQVRPALGASQPASYAGLPAAPQSPSGFRNCIRASSSTLKCTVAAVVVVALVFVFCTFLKTENHASLSHISVNSSSTVEVVNPSRIIKRTEQLYTIRTETIQDTVVHKVQQVSVNQNSHLSAASDAAAGSNLSIESAETREHLMSSTDKEWDKAEQEQAQEQEQQQQLDAGQSQHQAQEGVQEGQQAGASTYVDQSTQASRQQQVPEDGGVPKPSPEQLAPKAPQPPEEEHMLQGIMHATPEQLREAATKAPMDFNWQAYLSFYPDLVTAGVTSEDLAKFHYTTSGIHEKRLYKPLNVTVRYTACGGLMNQHYSHLAAMALAVSLNASVIIPPALSRNSFASYFSQDPKKNQVYWSAAPASSMWDIDYTRSFWAERGMKVVEGPGKVALPDLARPESAYPTYLPDGFSWAQVARITGVYLKSLSLHKLQEQALQNLLGVAMTLPDPSAPLLLDCPCTLFMMRTNTAPHLFQEAAHSLRFNREIQGLADKIIERMEVPAFNGLHLRMEDDAADWAKILGGRDMLLRLYMDACVKAGFDKDTPVYLASGLFTYGSAKDPKKKKIIKNLRKLSSRLMYKEMFLVGEDVKHLTKEQQALIDFLVIARARSFTGISVSTFSYYLQEHRALNGMPRSTTVLVSGKKVGTDPLFNRAARFADL